LLKSTQGAFRFAGGQLKQMSDKKIGVTTPVAALAVRGTEFWAGPIDGQYRVLLLKGKVDVSNRAGAVRLSRPGTGTDIPLHQRRLAKSSALSTFESVVSWLAPNPANNCLPHPSKPEV
jgi:hypothetical protein